MNELNKKMLKFAGFKRRIEMRRSADFTGIYIDKDGIPRRPPAEHEVTLWDYPEEGGFTKAGVSITAQKTAKTPADFPEDLNACFKWLEPELYRRGLRYQLHRVHDGHVAKIFKPGRTWADMVAYAFDEKPATAFCKAVELLMEKP